MGTTQLWQLYAWLITKSGRIRIHTQNLVLRKEGMSTRPFAFSRDLRLIARGSTLSIAESGLNDLPDAAGVSGHQGFYD